MADPIVDLLQRGMKQAKRPNAGNVVYKDECLYGFENPFSPNGLYVNLQNWGACGEQWLKTDSSRSNNNILYFKQVYRKIYKEKKEKDQPDKLALGVEGGFLGLDYELQKKYSLAVYDAESNSVVKEIPYPFDSEEGKAFEGGRWINDVPTMVGMVCDAIEKHQGAAAMAASTVWEDKDEVKPSKYADNLVQLPRDSKTISPDPSAWKCEIHGTTDNLWLNLSDGFIGGGRKNWDGSGGSGGALEHYQQEKAKGNEFPLVVKLGTITPHGADCYSYAPDEDDAVTDPKLAEHLAHWGIDIMKQDKTAKTTKEMELELNANYDWGKICESGAKLEKLRGPSYVGFANLGNTCYMNSCVQLLLSLQEVQSRYLDPTNELQLSVSGGPENMATDIVSQLSKLANATNGQDVLSKCRFPYKEDDPNDESNVVAPRMFRTALVEKASDFSTNRQQDAEEFLRYFFARLSKAEAPALETKRLQGSGETELLFGFEKEERYEHNDEVAYIDGVDCFLPVMIHMEDADNEPAAKKQKTGDEAEETIPNIPFEKAMSRLFAQEDLGPDHLFRGKRVLKSMRLKTMPKYLLVQIQRYYVDAATWTQKKRECTVPVPQTLDLDMYRAPKRAKDGLRDGEKAMPESGGDAGGDSAGAGSQMEPDMEIVTQLASMGFSENGCKRACLAVKNGGVEAASEWIFAHMEDPDFNDPPVLGAESGGGAADSSFDPEQVSMLQAITGMSDKHCKTALKANGGNADIAAAWLFEKTPAEIDAIADSQSGGASGGSGGSSKPKTLPDGPGKYSLCGFISHVGKATSSGHYVAHIKKNGQWCLFDDEKVAKSENTPLDYGYVYCFKRDD